MGERIKSMKIRNKLMMVHLVTCIVPLVIVSSFICELSAGYLEETSMEFAEVFNSQIISNINDFVDEYDSLTKSVLVDYDVIYKTSTEMDRDISAELNRQLEMRKIMSRLIVLKPEIKSIYIVTRQDEFYQFHGSSSDFASLETLKKQQWMHKIMETEELLSVSAVHNRSYCDNNRDGIVLTVSRKLLDRNGIYAGFLLINLEPDCLIELNERFLLARNRYNIKINVTDAWGGVLYDSDVASGMVSWKEVMESGETLLYQKNSEDYIILTSTGEKCGLSVNAVIPKSSLFFQINRVEYITVAIVLVCLAAVTILISLLSRTITKPISHLQVQMKKIEDGVYEELEGSTSHDEIGSLVESYNHMVAKIRSLIEDVYMAEIKQKNAKFLALQTQINPHMLYNTLESIRMKALMNGEDEISEMIKILAKMFRIALDRSDSPHTIREEVEYAKNYLQLQNIRFPDLYFFQVVLDERIQEAEIITMMFQPIIENSIEHGYRGKGIRLHITLSGEIMENGDVLLCFADDGKGIPAEKMEEINKMLDFSETDFLKSQKGEREKAGIGLVNNAERIKIHYGDSYYLHVRSEVGNGTVVEIRIPGIWKKRTDRREEQYV